MSQIKPMSHSKIGLLLHPQKTYQEIVAYLNTHWKQTPHSVIQKLDQALDYPSKQLRSVIIAGTNGKSTTIHYLTEIAKIKHIKIATFSSPHFVNYNERFAINGVMISNALFTDLANQVITLATQLDINPSSKDILTAMALLYFNNQSVDLAIFEREDIVNRDPITICTPAILGVPRIVQNSPELTRESINAIIDHISDKTHVISSNQSTLFLQDMEKRTKEKKGVWIMPIRKAAPLPYPFEQLFGRNATLAARIIQLYEEQFCLKPQTVQTKKLIKNLQLSSGALWKDINNEIGNTFHIINDHEKTILLDNASNLDAFNNLFLGIRLLNYQHSFKNIFFILANTKQQCDEISFIKLFRSCFTKFSGTLNFCTIQHAIQENWDATHLSNLAQYSKIKTMSFNNFKSAFHTISGQLKTKNDLLVITGSQAIISQYWKLRQGSDTL